jgi:predicted small lipoprotein YifL
MVGVSLYRHCVERLRRSNPGGRAPCAGSWIASRRARNDAGRLRAITGMTTRSAAAFLLILLTLTACGKRGSPQPPGPPDQVTYPKVYPTQ